jgi:hypothetical protein
VGLGDATRRASGRSNEGCVSSSRREGGMEQAKERGQRTREGRKGRVCTVHVLTLAQSVSVSRPPSLCREVTKESHGTVRVERGTLNALRRDQVLGLARPANERYERGACDLSAASRFPMRLLCGSHSLASCLPHSLFTIVLRLSSQGESF